MLTSAKDAIWQVSALNHEIKTLLEQGVGTIWIEGEVSNFSSPASGHWYFTLKDDSAQLRAAMFRNRNQRASFTPRNGQKILVRAQVTLYPTRGEFQVIVEHLEEAGIGRLMREFEALKRKLAAEGLFDARHKQDIPCPARHIGIITSPSGAAIRDALSVIRRKSPATPVTLFPAQVQGEGAVPGLIQALDLANRHAQCDVLLLIRGGGTLEDLWCFNDERLARALFDSGLPVISGVGHEIDTTIADLVADSRAPTPSVAAETVTLDQFEQMTRIDELITRAQSTASLRLQQHRVALEQLQQRLINMHPERQLANLQQNLGYAVRALLRVEHGRLKQRRYRSRLAFGRLQGQDPRHLIHAAHAELAAQRTALSSVSRRLLQSRQQTLAVLSGRIDGLSPLKTLARGYAAISDQQGKLVKSASDLDVGDAIEVRFGDGKRGARIES